MNTLRQHYINILAELADSYVIEDILNQITQTKQRLTKDCPNLGDLIRQSNYALS